MESFAFVISQEYLNWSISSDKYVHSNEAKKLDYQL